MKNKKNIDRLFQEKFKDFETAPSDAVWDRINENLPKKKKKRRVIALWWQIGGVAALIALLLTVGVSVFNSADNKTQDIPFVNTEKTDENLETDKSNIATDRNQSELNSTKNKDSEVVVSDIENESNTQETKNDALQKAASSNPLSTSNASQQKSNVLANTSKAKEPSASQKINNSTLKSDKDAGTQIATQTKPSNSQLEKNEKSQQIGEVERKSTIKTSIEENKSAIAENVSTKKDKTETSQSNPSKINSTESENLGVEASEKQSIEQAIAENNNTIDDDNKEEKRSKWSIAPNVAPVYFNSLGQGSSIDKQFNENSKSSNVSMSYGIAGSYSFSKKLKIRAGINRVNLNQRTSDVYAYSGAATAARGTGAEFNNILFRDDSQHVSLMSSTRMNRSTTPELFNVKAVGNIDQRFGFIEVPLELEYRLVDSRFGINVIGGFSTLILNENEIYADINGASTLIGEANNISDTSFSANFGLGMDYSLSKQWNINLEPTFKYQLNTFNNTSGDFKPFFIGLYTGLSYKF